MTFYIEKRLPKEEVVLFHQIRTAVVNLPDPDLGFYPHNNPFSPGEKILVSCHMLARAVAKVFKLRYKDGNFLDSSLRHSWVLTPEGNIIDLYPVATLGGPILVDNVHSIFSLRMYVPCVARKVSEGTFSSVWFLRGVRTLMRELRNPRLL